MSYPYEFKHRTEIDALTGIKSSLSKIRQVIALTYILFVTNNRQGFVEYCYSVNPTTLEIKPELLEKIKTFLKQKDIDDVINDNPLLKGQYESLYVGMTLLFRIANLKMNGKQNTAERTGGLRFPKQIYFASNIVMLDLILKGISDDVLKQSLFEWLKNEKSSNQDFENRVCSFLSVSTLFTQFKIRDNNLKEIFFQTEGIYKALIEGHKDITIDDSKESVGPTRIYKNLIKENLEPWITQTNGRLVFTNQGAIKSEDFLQIISTTLDINSVKDDAIAADNEQSILTQEDKKNEALTSFPLQQIYYGAPGTGKSHEIKEQAAEAEEQGRVFRTTFHPDSDYSTFVGCYKPTISQKAVRNVAGDVVKKDGKEVFEDYISYQFVPQAFTNAYVKAWQTNEPVFLIIEEINRGNCAQIFGDLFQLLDRGDDGVSDYPIKADTDLCQYLEKELGEDESKGIKDGKLCLPANLHIWATMNTSDQSLFPIDSAFKRRWDWHYTPICNANKGWKVEANGNQYDWWDFLQKINGRIERATSSEDKQLGYFFCKADGNGVISAEKFVSKVIFYLWNDVFKDFADSSDDPFKVADGNRMTFRSFYIADEKGKTIVNEDNVEALLGSLGVVSTFIDVNDSNELENSNGAKGFLINGEVEKVMMHVPSKVVSLYVEKNPDLSAAEIVSIWNTLETKGQYVFTSEEIQQKKTASIDEKLLGRYDPLSLKNGETIYVWNQMIQERIDDFSKKVNAQSWGIHIEPIA